MHLEALAIRQKVILGHIQRLELTTPLDFHFEQA